MWRHSAMIQYLSLNLSTQYTCWRRPTQTDSFTMKKEIRFIWFDEFSDRHHHFNRFNRLHNSPTKFRNRHYLLRFHIIFCIVYLFSIPKGHKIRCQLRQIQLISLFLIQLSGYFNELWYDNLDGRIQRLVFRLAMFSAC